MLNISIISVSNLNVLLCSVSQQQCVINRTKEWTEEVMDCHYLQPWTSYLMCGILLHSSCIRKRFRLAEIPAAQYVIDEASELTEKSHLSEQFRNILNCANITPDK